MDGNYTRNLITAVQVGVTYGRSLAGSATGAGAEVGGGGRGGIQHQKSHNALHFPSFYRQVIIIVGASLSES